MARYINADLLTEIMRNRYDQICDTYGYHDLYASGYDDAVDAVENAPTADVVPMEEVERLEKEIKALVAFKEYFSELYGTGLDVANWHQNGALEPFDNFYESAEDEYEAEIKKKYTEE